MTVFNIPNMNTSYSTCYMSSEIQCPINYTSITGYYPGCCRICERFFKLIIPISKIFLRIIYPVSYEYLTPISTTFLNLSLSNAGFECSFQYISNISLPECTPSGYVQWIIADNKTKSIVANASLNIKGNTIISDIKLLSIISNPILESKNKTVRYSITGK